MPRRASPYLYKVSGVRKRHTLRTGNTCTSKHVTIATTLGEAARDAEMTARASLGLSPLHPPPLHQLPNMLRKLRCTLLRRAPATHQTRNARAAPHRFAARWRGRACCNQPRSSTGSPTPGARSVAARVAEAGRRACPPLSFAKQALRVKNFRKD